MTKSDAVEIIIEVSDMLADNLDYESYRILNRIRS